MRVLYFDIDSVIFIYFHWFSYFQENHYEPELDDYSVKLTNEINFIEEFVSTGPNNYGYKISNAQTSCKI